MADPNVAWETCADDGCIGVRLPTGGKCWAHAASSDLDAALQRLGKDGQLNARGVPITQELLWRLLAAAPQDDHGHAGLADAWFDRATFEGTAWFNGVTFQLAWFKEATFQGEARFTGATFKHVAEFKAATFRSDAAFERAIFEAEASFQGATFQGEAQLAGASFQGDTWFRGATFQGNVAFERATCRSYVDFERAIFEGEAGFGGATFHRMAAFRGAMFEDRARFTGATFQDIAEFQGATFQQGAGFAGATFKGTTWFEAATFKDYAIFDGATFQDSARFTGATFQDSAGFEGVTFQDTRFEGATFQRRAEFRRATFQDSATFDRATFQDIATFDRAIFQGNPSFNGATFQRNAWFKEATFHDIAWFRGATFQRNAVFLGATFHRARWLGPMLVRKNLLLDQAVFHDRAQIQVAAAGVCCQQTRFPAGVQLRVRWAKVVLDDADLAAPSILAGAPAFQELQEGRWARALERLARARATSAHPGQPWLVSVCRADVAGLTVAGVDLRVCRFVGAHHLDRLRVEESDFPATPTGWRWSARQTIAEEDHWRTVARSAGWHHPGHRPPAWLETEPPTPAQIAALYRALRKGREDNKDEPGAADFYYGEMEMRRHDPTKPRAERLVLFLYWLLSGYALRASRALAWLLGVLAIASVLLAAGGLEQPAAADWSFPARLGTAALAALEGAVFRASEQQLTYMGRLIQAALRFAGPILLGLAVLSIRGRVKR